MATDIVAYGIYPDRGAFEQTLDALRAAGFRNSDISAILPDRDHTTRDLAAEINTKAPEGFTTGASTGAAVGGVLGWLVGIGAIVIPGIGPIVAAGPVVAALAGAGAAGATGGLVGGLIGAGIPEIEAKRYGAHSRRRVSPVRPLRRQHVGQARRRDSRRHRRPRRSQDVRGESRLPSLEASDVVPGPGWLRPFRAGRL
jgi:hypothetical protein